MKKNKINLFVVCLLLSSISFAQKNGWYDTSYVNTYMGFKTIHIEKYFYKNDTLLKSEKYNDDEFSNQIGNADFLFYNDKGTRGYGFVWNVHYDTFLLAKYLRFRSSAPEIDSTYTLYKYDGGEGNTGSVRVFTGYIKGKEVRKEYVPGELYLDYPINPDTLPSYFKKLCKKIPNLK